MAPESIITAAAIQGAEDESLRDTDLHGDFGKCDYVRIMDTGIHTHTYTYILVYTYKLNKRLTECGLT